MLNDSQSVTKSLQDKDVLSSSEIRGLKTGEFLGNIANGASNFKAKFKGINVSKKQHSNTSNYDDAETIFKNIFRDIEAIYNMLD